MNGIFFKYSKVNYPSSLLYLYALDANLDVDWNTASLSNINKSIALDPLKGVVYANVNSALKGYSYSTGSILYSVTSSYIPIVVDDQSNVWTLLYKSNKICKYNNTLSSYVEYTLKTGNPLNDYIYDFILSKDQGTIFLCGGANAFPRVVACYSLSNLNGGDATWSETYGAEEVAALGTMDIDNFDNIYCGSGRVASGGLEDVVISLDKNGNRRWRSANCSYAGLVVAKKTNKLFACDYDYLRQFDLDGNLIAQTKRYQTAGFPGYFRYLAIADDDETKLLAGMEGAAIYDPTYQGLYLMNISEDWTDVCDPQLDAFRIAYGSYQFSGDPTGYRSKFYQVEETNSYKVFEESPLVKTKPKIFSVNLYNNQGKLNISESDFITDTILQPTRCLTISKEAVFTASSINTNRKITAGESNFIVTEDKNFNVTVKPYNSNTILNSQSENIVVNKEYV